MCAQNDQVGRFLSAVQTRLGPQKFNAWFKHGTRVCFEDGHVKIGAANPFVAGWIESHFAEVMRTAAREVTHRRLDVLVNVDPELSGRSRKGQLDAQARLVARGTAGRGRREPAPRVRLRHRLEDFVVGPPNELAFSAAAAVAKAEKTAFNPLFIHGACGVGKTHLLQGICNAIADRRDASGPVACRYLTAEQFTNEFVETLRRKKLDGFRATYRRLDVLVIDDVHFLAAKKATQEEFLHTFNTIESAGKQVVMASDAAPRMIGHLTEQLVSRFLAGMVVRIDPPDRATRMKILQRASERLKADVPTTVLDYIAQHIRGSVRELEGALVKLTALAGLSAEPITLALARDALADHLAQTDSALTMGDIETAVAAFFGVTPADLHSTRRTHTVSLARSIAMHLARRHTPMSFPEIGRFMGKNHSSVVLAAQRIEKSLADDAECRWITPAGPKTMGARGLLRLLTDQLP